MRVLSFLLLMLTTSIVLAQNPINQTDSQGRKQGFWSKRDASGSLVYQATFKDDKPVGEMKRFHPNGKLLSVMNFTEGSDMAEAQLIDERGQLIARGNYSGQKKTGEWLYFVDQKISLSEMYLNGAKNGISKRFYPGGELLEESNWQNNMLHGVSRTYYQDGKLQIECTYSNGMLHGKYKTCFPDGGLELDGSYTNNNKDKSWKYYDVNGELSYTLNYTLGELLNPQVQDSIDALKQNSYKPKGNTIPDPEKFIQNPDEYMRLMKTR